MLSLDATVHVLWLGTPVAACVSGACVLTAIGGSSWLSSEERIPNPSYRNGSSKVEYLTKCTVSGLFTLCATEVGKTEFRCSKIDYFPSEAYSPDPHDSTTAIPYTVLKSVGYFLTAAVLLGVAEVLCLNGHCCRRRRFFTFVSGIVFVVAGLVMMLGVVIYIATLKGEVGDKLRPRSAFQPPRFTYTYGWCFLLLMLGFVATEAAGIAAIFLYIYWHKREWRQKCQQGVLVGAPPHPLLHAPHALTCRAPRPPASPRSGGAHYMLEYVALDHQHRDTLHHNHVPSQLPNHYTPATHHYNHLPPNPHHHDNHVGHQEGRQRRQHQRQESGRSQKLAIQNATESQNRRSASCLPVRRPSRRRSSGWDSDDAPPAPLVPPAPPPAQSFSGRPRGGRSLTDLHKDVCWDRVLTSGSGGSLPRSQKLSRSLPRGASLSVSWSSDVEDRPMSAPSAGGTVPKSAPREGWTLPRGISMDGGILSGGSSMEGGVLSRSASMERGSSSRCLSIEGGTLSGSISVEGGTLPRGTSMDGGTLPRDISMEGGTLPRGTSIEGGILARGATKDPRRYSSLPRGVTLNLARTDVPHPQELLSTAGGASCPACCAYCDSCCYCCCCCWADEGTSGDPRAPAPCNLARTASGGRYDASFPWPSATCPHDSTSPTRPRLACSTACSPPPQHLPATSSSSSSHSLHPLHYSQSYQDPHEGYQQHPQQRRQFYHHHQHDNGDLEHLDGEHDRGEGGHSSDPSHHHQHHHNHHHHNLRRTTPV